MPFRFERMAIPGIMLVEPTVLNDERGFFMESYRLSEFSRAGIAETFVQENQSGSKQGTLRGLHYQIQPWSQGKLVRVLLGEIFDVAVDIRKGSPSYGKWVGTRLSAENRRLLYLPPWCAHGFCVLSETAEVLYKTTREYSPGHEVGIAWNDPSLGIQWPVESPILSDRDRHWPAFEAATSSSSIA